MIKLKHWDIMPKRICKETFSSIGERTSTLASSFWPQAGSSPAASTGPSEERPCCSKPGPFEFVGAGGGRSQERDSKRIREPARRLEGYRWAGSAPAIGGRLGAVGCTKRVMHETSASVFSEDPESGVDA